MSAAVFSYDFTELGNGSETGCSFWMSQQNLARQFSRALPRRAADLMDVFGAVYAADRRSKRCFRGVATGQRRICIRCPVRETGLWTSPELTASLRELLAWVSEDVWDIKFVRRGSVLDQDSNQGFLMDVPAGIPGKSLAVQRRAGLPGRPGAPCPELTRWLPGLGVRPHPRPSGMPTGRPGEADQVCMGTGIPRGHRRRESCNRSLRHQFRRECA